MVETLATSQYKEKFFGPLSIGQSLIALGFLIPGLFMIIRKFNPYFIGAYALFYLVIISGIVFFQLDEKVMLLMNYYFFTKKRLLWKTKDIQKFIGVNDITDDTVYTFDGKILSVIKVVPKDLFALSEDEIERVLVGYGRFLNELSTSIQIIMSSTEVDVEGFLRRLKEKITISGKPEKMAYFQDFSDHMRAMVSSKSVTDRDYYIVVTRILGANKKKSLTDLDIQTQNLMASLKSSGITCGRLETDNLIKFYANFYNPHFKLGGETWSPFSIHYNLEALDRAEKFIDEHYKNIDPATALYLLRDYEYRPIFNPDGEQKKMEDLDRKTFIKEQLMPSSIDITRDSVEIEKMHRILFTVRFPTIVQPGWLTHLISLPIDFDLVFHIHPLQQNVAISYLESEIRKLETDVTIKQREGLIVKEEDKNTLEKVREVMQRVANDQEKCFDVAMYFNVKAYDKKSLDVACLRVKSILEGMNAQVKVANYEMSDAIISCYPIANDKLGERRDKLMPGSAVRDTYPFILSSFEEGREGAIVVGYNQLNRIPVIIDNFRQPNPHILVLGSSGSGKSFFVKKYFMSQAMEDVDIYLIDPMGEYVKVVEEMGGTVINFDSSSDNVINLFDLTHSTYDQRKSSIKAFFNIVRGSLESLSGASIGIIDKMVDNAYNKEGIYATDPSSWSKTPPTFSGIYNALKNLSEKSSNKKDDFKRTVAEALLTYITPFVYGDMRFLNQQTSVNIKGKNIVCFNLRNSKTSDSQRALLLFIIFDHIVNHIIGQESKKRKQIILDEAWSVFSTNSDDYLQWLVRVGRHHNLSVLMIDQNVEDFLAKGSDGLPRGHVVLNNTDTKFIFRQEANALNLVVDKFALNKAHMDYLRTASPGNCLMMTSGVKLPLFVAASERDVKLMSTTPEELQTEEYRPDSELTLGWDKMRDRVLPSEVLSIEEVNRLEKEGFKLMSDSGLSDKRQTLFYVRAPENENKIHYLRRTLVYKYLESLREKEGIRSEEFMLKIHDKKFADITFLLPKSKKYVYVELLDEQDLDLDDEENTEKLKKLMRQKNEHENEVIFVALNKSIYDAFLTRNFEPIMTHEVRREINKLIKEDLADETS